MWRHKGKAGQLQAKEWGPPGETHPDTLTLDYSAELWETKFLLSNPNKLIRGKLKTTQTSLKRKVDKLNDTLFATATTKEQSTDIHSNIDESPNPDVEQK